MDSPDESFHSDRDEDLEVSFHPHHTFVPPNNPVGPSLKAHEWIGQSMMTCTTIFLKWHLKCKNILECELAALPEHQKCKKVIAWSSDCGMDQYVSWNLPSSKLTLDMI